MKKCLFVARHAPTTEQILSAQQIGVELVHVGDVDFCRGREQIVRLIAGHGADGVSVVNPGNGLDALSWASSPDVSMDHFFIMVAMNGDRPAEGAKSSFSFAGWRVWVWDSTQGLVPMDPDWTAD